MIIEVILGNQSGESPPYEYMVTHRCTYYNVNRPFWQKIVDQLIIKNINWLVHVPKCMYETLNTI